ncbi:MAG: RNA polymerase factor sigma-54, partial [Nitrosomonadales bacterium]|nr:RNA polymerase factor sigma-54 [Nitrosomonadales bacterium]
MKNSLQLRISQQLTLTPQLQQAIRLLQLSTQDMHQEVARLLEENPMLEAAEEPAANTFSLDGLSIASQNTATTTNDEFERSSDDDRGADDFANEPSDWNTGGGAMRSTDDEDEPQPEQAAEQATLRAHL